METKYDKRIGSIDSLISLIRHLDGKEVYLTISDEDKNGNPRLFYGMIKGILEIDEDDETQVAGYVRIGNSGRNSLGIGFGPYQVKEVRNLDYGFEIVLS